LVRRHCRNHRPKVLYPSIDEKSFLKSQDYNETVWDLLLKNADNDEVKKTLSAMEDVTIVMSLNRYERKKNINLALESYAYYKKNKGGDGGKSMLVVAGGYDERLDENV
jgi:alpha-1,3/alpha-1,6-mannosyltransferase